MRIGILLVAAFALLTPAGVLAQGARSVTLERRDGQIAVQPNGDLQISETWVVRFSGGPFQSANRTFPLEGRTFSGFAVSEGTTAYRESSDRQPGTFSTATSSGNRTITWYFSPTTDATRTFELRYTVGGAIQTNGDISRFAWIFIERDRQYPIESSTVTLALPASAEPLEAGSNVSGGAQPARTTVAPDRRSVVYQGGPFPAGSAWELRAQFPAAILPDRPAPAEPLAPQDALALLGSAALGFFAFAGGLLALFVARYVQRPRPRGLVAEYFPQPPDASPPALAGWLVDGRVTTGALIATLVDLARRGYLRMTESAGDLSFARLRDGADLPPFERTLLDLAAPSEGATDLATVQHALANGRRTIVSQIDADARQGGWVASPRRALPIAGALFFLFLVAPVACLAALVALPGLWGYLIIAPMLALMVVALVAIVMTLFAPRRTDAGVLAAARWKAFRRYLENLDRYTTVQQARDQFEHYLPFAIAFGLERSWIERFAAIDVPAPAWYVGKDWDETPSYHRGSDWREPTRDEPTSFIAGPSEDPSSEDRPSADRSREGSSLDRAASSSFGGLNAASAGLFALFNSAGSVFDPPASTSSSGDSGGWSWGSSDSGSSWSSSDSGGSSSDSGGSSSFD
ncbi:MAG: DUF2207 domain-containing protein [Dehalococcoidia bacterium]